MHIKWVAQEQVTSVTPKLLNYFASEGYQNLVRTYTRPELFSIDWDNVTDQIPGLAASSLSAAASLPATTVTTTTTTTTTTPEETAAEPATQRP